MYRLVTLLLCLHQSLCLEAWGSQHTRDNSVDSVLVLPSSDGSSSLRIEDLPQNNQWGLVEISSDTDLQHAEYR